MISYWGVEHGDEVSKRQGDNSLYERMPRQARSAIKTGAATGLVALPLGGLYGAAPAALVGGGVGAGIAHHRKHSGGKSERRWRGPRKVSKSRTGAARGLAKPASIFDKPPAATNTGYRPGQGSMGMGGDSVVPGVLRNQKPAGFTGKGPNRKKNPSSFNTVRGLY